MAHECHFGRLLVMLFRITLDNPMTSACRLYGNPINSVRLLGY